MIIGKSKKKLAELSEQIDKILHGNERVDIQMFKEGELYILQNQINKMTVRLREQNSALKKDKLYLADSMADIAHQLRTPMTSLQMLMNFLSNPGLNADKQSEFVRQAENLLSRMDWLLSSLLKMSKIDAGTVTFKKEKTTLKSLLKKSAEPFAIPLELRGIRQEIMCTEETTFVGDINWTAEAVGNVLKNCIEHTRDEIKIVCEENNIYTSIIISDNGNGFPKEELPHIFERFYKGESQSNENYGIGLALCRMILSEQNMTIKAENSKDSNQGARFIIRIYPNTPEYDGFVI
ncbi:MAG: HAMP domain-containing histidine kinase [Oscillospiraceae bacterium]|nr:HAMP domain-containing histidine kinase [Oscillospiraceae bacterium]